MITPPTIFRQSGTCRPTICPTIDLESQPADASDTGFLILSKDIDEYLYALVACCPGFRYAVTGLFRSCPRQRGIAAAGPGPFRSDLGHQRDRERVRATGRRTDRLLANDH